MGHDDVVARLVAIEGRVADRLGFPAVPGRTAAEGIRAFKEREARQGGEVETTVSLPDPVIQRVFLCLCERYGVEVYRRPRQRGGDVTVRAPRRFAKDGLGWMFQEVGDVFQDWYVAQTESALRAFESGGASSATEPK